MTRTLSHLDTLANTYWQSVVARSPLTMTALGLPDRQDEYDDLSPEGLAATARLARSTRAAIDGVTLTDSTDAVTAAALRERLGLIVETHDDEADLTNISNIESGLHTIREAYDLMPVATESDWATIARRLHAVPPAVKGWFASQFAGIEAGIAPARRQVDALADQCAGWIADTGFFAGLLDQARTACPGLSATTRDQLAEGVAIARRAYACAIETLRDKVRPLAVVEDGVGRARYELASRFFLGMTVDFAETYRWGLDQVAELEARQAELCAGLRPGLTVAETKRALDEDPAYLLDSPEAMEAWMQSKADGAIAALDGVHFDIPEPARRIECLIAPTHDGAIYYTDATDDFSRPGRMWWSVPEGQTTFSTWRELTTVYHEGVPGHHLQCSQAIYNRAELNDWRRRGIWVSGHGEGWALYAEQLMADLGMLDDPAMMLGMLDGQAMRAVRVVIDLGIHCGFAPPTEVGGTEWTFERALAYFNSHVAMDPDVAKFEVMRYFGWPGQAPSYKIGQRVWTEIRDEAQQREGAEFSLKAFHARALGLGALGLDTLRWALGNH
ncbi:MAG: DUF885 domain-containing protein [Propionibacteriaceae bacterium]|jgi:uncharacterized protein (DUF885 family)|nr:DUF885 domain-containing protein [Propionibacteriaceae bacterium]